MPRDITAYLYDIIDACDSITSILSGISMESYAELREKRSAVEREFIIIGEATSILAKFSPEKFNRLSDGRKTIGFRNVLTHNYVSVDHETVYETALQDVPKLKKECIEILIEAEAVVKNNSERRSGAD